jgi:hypothetical protein
MGDGSGWLQRWRNGLREERQRIKSDGDGGGDGGMRRRKGEGIDGPRL